jgi:hypothetical protein
MKIPRLCIFRRRFAYNGCSSVCGLFWEISVSSYSYFKASSPASVISGGWNHSLWLAAFPISSVFHRSGSSSLTWICNIRVLMLYSVMTVHGFSTTASSIVRIFSSVVYLHGHSRVRPRTITSYPRLREFRRCSALR